MSWSLEEYCGSQRPIDWESLTASSKSFLQALDLPDIHPFCDNHDTFYVEGVPPMGRLEDHFDGESTLERFVTIWYMVAPPLLAMAELWLRLFAGALGPLGCFYLLFQELGMQQKRRNYSKCNDNYTITSLICLISVASTLIVMTDTLYVHDYGPYYGAFFFVLSVILSIRASIRHNLTKVALIISGIVLLASHLVWDYSTDTLSFGNVVEKVSAIDEGLYFNPSNSLIQSIVNNWPEKYRIYSKANGATPWMPSGDSRTGLPFLLNHPPLPDWNRLFLKTDDDEYVALDISFPKKESGGHDPEKPMYLILHGLNGGSTENYVRDLTLRATEDGSTVVVMVARGLMDLPIRGWSLFHGARTSDVHESALTLQRVLGPNQLLVGVGYSMGAIILNNYASRYGQECALNAAIAISGGLDMRYQEDFYRARRLWQPLLAETMRNDFLLGKWGHRVKSRLPKNIMLQMMRATDVTEIDDSAIVHYNGFRDLDHYYSEMSALGDIPIKSEGLLDEEVRGRIHSVSIPLCVLHALDDPLITWRTTVSNHGLMRPENLVRTGSGNTMLLITKAGGHVGWPVGLIPFIGKWRWMSEVVISFASAVYAAKQKVSDTPDLDG